MLISISSINIDFYGNLPVGWDLGPPSPEDVAELRSQYGLLGCQVALYAGTFGKNQGLELSIDALRRIRPSLPKCRLLLVGGTGADLARVKAHAHAQGMGDAVVFAGSQPHTAMPGFMALADVLLSPRLRGTNTPLKIYSYLAAAKPIVATDLPTHTQVLSPETAELVEATPEALGEGIRRILTDPARARALAEAGRRLAEEEYGIEPYMQRLTAILERIPVPKAA